MGSERFKGRMIAKERSRFETKQTRKGSVKTELS